MSRVTCAECAHLEAADSTCHKNPPGTAGWVTVALTDWCGEATRQPEEPAAPPVEA